MNPWLIFRLEVVLSTRRKRPRAGDVAPVLHINTSFIGIYLNDTCNKHVDEFGIINAATYI